MDHGPEVGEVVQLELVLVGVVEDELQARFLGLIEIHDPGQQDRAEGVDGRPNRDARPLTPEGVELGRERRCFPFLSDGRIPGLQLLAALALLGQAGQIALDVRQENRDAVRGELLGHGLEGLGLARTSGTGDETVPIHHRQGKTDRDVRLGLTLAHGDAEVHRFP